MRFISHLFPFIAFAFAMTAASCTHDSDGPVRELVPGDALPQFSVTLMDGTTVTTESLRGRKSMIVLFNTHCLDCQAELPEIQKVYEKAGCAPGVDDEDRIPVLCIARSENASEVQAYWTENGLTLPVSPQDDDSVYLLFADRTIPRIFISSPDLIITHSFAELKVEASVLLGILEK